MMMRWLLQICFTVMALLASASVSSAKCTHNGKAGTHLEHCAGGFICGFHANSNFHRNALIDEARRRGLSCKIAPIKKATNVPPSLLKKSFIVLSKDQRKLVQVNLARENLYTSTVDGLYGKGTAAALKAYNKEYLGNADLSKASNAKALIADLLKERPSEVVALEAAVAAKVELEKPKIVDPEPEPPLVFAQVKASYDAKEFSKAFTDAQVLAIQGDTNAQFYLGKMYADGRGTIQVSTAAHMWFNIASMNGSDEAYEQRKAVTAQMTPSAVEKAQAMAMTCIQSAYTDCGLTVKPVASKAEPVTKAETVVSSLKSHFKEQSLLKRKQIQYALKKLGVYSSSVDGAWGSGTATAVSNYQNIQNMQTKSPSELYASVLSKVEVPSSFSAPKRTAPKKKAAPKAQQAKKPVYPDGWRSFSANPQFGFTQAKAICEPQARNAGDSAAKPESGTSFRCNSFGSSVNCRDTSGPKSVAEGFLTGMLQGMDRRTARTRVMNSCMAQYGWTKQ
ncbi:MAG: peptidoglycan-binding protein [Oceanospirillaceae bacterium]